MNGTTKAGIALALTGAGILALALYLQQSPPDEAVALPAIATADGPTEPPPEPGTAAPAAVAAPKTEHTCKDCREKYCRNWLGHGVDIVAGCFERPDENIVKDPDPQFIQDCVDVVQCAFENKCGTDPVRGPAVCYCGFGNTNDECVEKGPDPKAPCIEQWKRATRSKTHQEVVSRFDNTLYPSGWAFAMLQCDRDFCGEKSKDGRCTP